MRFEVAHNMNDSFPFGEIARISVPANGAAFSYTLISMDFLSMRVMSVEHNAPFLKTENALSHHY